MEKLNYSVTVESNEQHHPHYEVSCTSKVKAVAQAKKWASEHSDKLVYIEFHRASDGQVGYINPDGAGISGKSWT